MRRDSRFPSQIEEGLGARPCGGKRSLRGRGPGPTVRIAPEGFTCRHDSAC